MVNLQDDKDNPDVLRGLEIAAEIINRYQNEDQSILCMALAKAYVAATFGNGQTLNHPEVLSLQLITFGIRNALDDTRDAIKQNKTTAIEFATHLED